MSNSDMKIFNEFFQPAISETVAQITEEFNAASGGAIQLMVASNIGDFVNNSFYNILSAAQRRVDRYSANNPVSAIPLTQSERNFVKVAGGFGPVLFEPAQMNWLRKPTAEGIEMISRQFSSLLLQDQLNTAIAALVAAISNQPGATNDVSGGNAITQRVINGSHRLFGDASMSLVAEVMTGSMYHQLVDKALANAEELFQAGNVTVMNILGKMIVITDAPALLEAGSPNKDKVLSLSAGAVIVRDPADPVSNIDTRNGKERIETTMQVDYDFTLDLKGYSWNVGAGGKSPTDAEIATGSNWTLASTSIKHTAGVIAIGDEA